MGYLENRQSRTFIVTDAKKRKHKVAARSSLEAGLVYADKPLFFGEVLPPAIDIEDTKPFV